MHDLRWKVLHERKENCWEIGGRVFRHELFAIVLLPLPPLPISLKAIRREKNEVKQNKTTERLQQPNPDTQKRTKKYYYRYNSKIWSTGKHWNSPRPPKKQQCVTQRRTKQQQHTNEYSVSLSQPHTFTKLKFKFSYRIHGICGTWWYSYVLTVLHMTRPLILLNSLFGLNGGILAKQRGCTENFNSALHSL